VDVVTPISSRDWPSKERNLDQQFINRHLSSCQAMFPSLIVLVCVIRIVRRFLDNLSFKIFMMTSCNNRIKDRFVGNLLCS
jgi:hypothetical protein